MKHILITGTSKGIGLEFVRQYLSLQNKITAITRKKSQELTNLAEQFDSLSIIEADIASLQGMQQIASSLNGQPIDILVLNAGVYHRLDPNQPERNIEKWQESFFLNCISPITLTQLLRNNLEASEQATVVGITSKMGSLGDNRSGGSYIYRTSKAALNAALKSLSHDLKALEIPVLILHPGWVKTDMGGPHALINTQESVQGMRAMIDQATVENTGSFYAFDGERLPW